MGPDRMTPAYGHGRKNQRCTDDTYSCHQRVMPCLGTGSTISPQHQYSSTATSGEYYEDGDEDYSDLDDEHVAELRQASEGVPMFPSPRLPPSSHTVGNEALHADHPTHSPLFPSDASVTSAHVHMRRHAFNPPPKLCSLIPSFRGSATSESEPAYSSPESGYPVPRAEDFQWDFPDPFKTPATDPTRALAVAGYAKMRLNVNIAPNAEGYNKVWEHLSPPPPPPSPLLLHDETESSRFQAPVPRLSLGAVGGGTQLGTLQSISIPSRPVSFWGGCDPCTSRGIVTSSDGICSFALLRTDLEYANAMLEAQESREAEEANAQRLCGRGKPCKTRTSIQGRRT